jgi:hypothetical protein
MKNFTAYSVFSQRLAMAGAAFITASITLALWQASLLLPA